jgi:DNA mismatch repair protein MutL
VREGSEQESLELVAPLLGRAGGGTATAVPTETLPQTTSERSAEPERGTATAEGGEASEVELWQLHRTYLLAPVRNGLVIIDQHAAHERILYEEIRARLEGGRGASQQLLFPTLVELSRSQYALLEEIGPWLQQLGWDAAALGPPTVVVRGVPVELAQRTDVAGFLQDLLDEIAENSNSAPHEDVVEHLARSYACHAAIKAGDPLAPEERRMLVNRLFATRVPHGDPHGRVTYVRLDLEELHRRFGRS